MFETLKNAWKVTDIRKKLLFTLMIVVLYRLGSNIPVPFIDGQALKAAFDNTMGDTILGYFNLLSGDAFSKGTLFALNISPYITSSIVVQLLAVAIPAMEKWAKSGPEGQEKLNKLTRAITIVLALVMSYGYYIAIGNNLTQKGWFPCIVIVACFTAGASLTMWLGERIDEKGIGNGISMVLFAGIVARGPQLVGIAWTYISNAFTEGQILNLLWVVLALAFMVAVCIFVVHITNAERRVPVQYAKRQQGRKVYGGNNSFLPLKLNMTGVMPIIFAQAIVSIPATLALIFSSWNSGVTRWFSPSSPFPFYIIVFFVMIIAFAYFYVSISFNPTEVASNLQKNGGTVLGYRPGKPTSDFITKILNRVTLLGAIYLSIIAIFPMIISMVNQWFTSAAGSIFSSLAFGGTSLLIIIGVALETTRELEAQLTMRNYKGFLD